MDSPGPFPASELGQSLDNTLGWPDGGEVRIVFQAQGLSGPCLKEADDVYLTR